MPVFAWVCAFLATCALAAALPAAAETSDRFVAGATVTELAPVGGDLFAAGGSVDVEAAVAGDAVVAGGKVRIGADVGQSVYAAAGQLSLLGRVGHNARLAGGRIEMGPAARIAGNLSVAGGRVAVRGTVDGALGAAGRSVSIDASVGGDVEVAAGEISLGPNARIAGNLRYRSPEPLQRDAGAQVAGSIERLGPELSESAREEIGRRIGTGLAVLWTIGLVVLAALALAVLPRLTASIARTLRTRLGASLVVGFVVLVCTPIAVVLSFVTVIGIPLGLLVLLVYLMLLPLAWVAAAIGIGDWVVSKVAASRAERTGARIVAAALALIALAFAVRTPWLGGGIAFAALIAGLGASALQLLRLRPR